VFALGITLWEIFHRNTPFKGMPEMACCPSSSLHQIPHDTSLVGSLLHGRL